MNAFAQFLASRAKGQKPVTNADTPVTRTEFTQLANVVNALMEDVQAATDPAKLTAVINTAFEAAAKGVTPPPVKQTVNARRLALAPGDDTARSSGRAHLAPKGE